MAGIICAIRGGPGSEGTIRTAIDLAKRAEQTLHFLYVVNVEFLQRTESSRTRSLSNELENMGDFILLNARAEAQSLGVDAQGAVRHGNVTEEIVEFADELDADYIVMGRPGGEEEDNVFTSDQFESFMEQIAAKSRAQIIIAQEEA